MSTSPSWFDQEKFSRLVKKVGPKAVHTGPLPAAAVRAVAPTSSPEKETKRLLRRAAPAPEAVVPEEAPPKPVQPPAQARTGTLPPHDAPIRATPQEPSSEPATPSSFPAPLPLPETRSVSPLARRTTSLPNLKPIFEYDKPPQWPSAGRGVEPEPEVKPEPEPAAEVADEPSWPRVVPRPPEPMTERENPASSGGTDDELDQLMEQRDQLMAKVEELSRAEEERDDARNEVNLLRTQLQQADEIIQAAGVSGSNQEEILRLIEDRDNARRDYASLREQYESLKQGQGRSPNGFQGGKTEDEEDATGEQEEKIHGLEDALARLKEELSAMQGQVGRYRDEASVAQRGLALSQKALQETRDALRETSESFSLTKANVENLKNECSTLAQQNMLLQAQHDQVSRELSATKAKLGGQG